MTDTTASQNKNDTNASATSSNLSNPPTGIWPYDLYAEQPVSFWQQELKFDAKALFLHLSKAAVSGATADSSNVVKHTLDALASFSVKESAKDKASVAVWALIFNAMSSALNELMEDYQDLFSLPADMLPTEAEQQSLSAAELKEKHKLAKQMQERRTIDVGELLARAFANANIAIPHDFFSRPETLPLFAHIESPLIDWLQVMGMNHAEATAFYNRLRQTFVLHLHKTWLSDYEHYTCIEHAVDSPFSAGVKTERAWHAYHAWLQAQTEQRMFAEAFSLRDVYVPLNAWYKITEDDDYPNEEKQIEKEIKKQVVSLHNEMTNWVKHFNKNMAVRVISGGPGAGKSSFAKLFAADICRLQPDIKVLFIPLHHFNIDADLTSAVNRFVTDDLYLSGNPLDAQTGEKRLLIIFDGLDELSMQGKSASDAANDFVEEVLARINRFNDQGAQRQAIVTGRDVAISSASSKLRERGQILQVLPYFFDEPKRERKSYLDPNKLLKNDLRQTWWQNFANAKQLNYTGLPKALNAKQLVPITREPLLNYLVALSFERNQVKFNEHTSLNEIYSDLLKAVYERQYENKRIHQSTATLKFTQFERVLEEIALAVWHNGGNQDNAQAATGNNRVATLGQIEKQLTNSSSKKHLEQFTQGAEKGVTRLLTAFYFRESQHRQHSDKSFEFTHKSFGEYLIAKRIVRAVQLIDKKRRENDADSDDGWSKTEALKYWAEICGISAFDKYVFKFVKDEIKSSHSTEVDKWQSTFNYLFNHVINYGVPADKLNLPSFNLMMDCARNAEESLALVLSLCSKETKSLSTLNLGENKSLFGKWLKQVQEHPLHSYNFHLVHQALSYLDFQKQHLAYLNLGNCSLISSDLSNCEIFLTNLTYADLSYCSLNKANLSKSNLSRAVLVRSDLSSSVMKDAILVNTALPGANMSEAKLHNAVLIKANMKFANLTNASCVSANFSYANLKSANLQGINIDQANFSGADLARANISGVNFSNVLNLDKVKNLHLAINLNKAIFPEGFEIPKPETIAVSDDEQQENVEVE